MRRVPLGAGDTAYLKTKADITDFTRKLKLKDVFYGQSFEDESLVKKKSNFTPISKNQDLLKIVDIIEKSDPINIQLQDNLTPQIRKALSELKNEKKLVIKKADKGNTLVVMSSEFYSEKLVMNDHLNTRTYCKTDQNSDNITFRNLKKLMKKHEKCLTKKEFAFITNYKWETSNIYVLPKIHKNSSIIQRMNTCNNIYLEMDPPPDLKGRPIIAGPNAPTQHLSKILDKIISPLVPLLQSYIKDDWDFYRKLPSKFDYDCTLYSCDIVSLYSNITHELGLTAMEFWINKYRSNIPERFTTEFILESAKFILNNNNFYFNSCMYRQLIGTAMGTIFAPPYACLAIGFLEFTNLYPALENRFNSDISQIIKERFFRFMDDGFIPWPNNADINIFLDIINSMNPSINFTLEAAKKKVKNQKIVQSLDFLDITILLLENGNIETDIFYKPTNTHDYLDYQSHHPMHIKDNIPYNLAKRIIVLCLNSDTEKLRLMELKKWLLNCNYPEKLIDRKIHCAKLRGPAPKRDNLNVIPFITTYSSNYDSNHLIKTVINYTLFFL